MRIRHLTGEDHPIGKSVSAHQRFKRAPFCAVADDGETPLAMRRQQRHGTNEGALILLGRQPADADNEISLAAAFTVPMREPFHDVVRDDCIGEHEGDASCGHREISHQIAPRAFNEREHAIGIAIQAP
jgi:hypothetical protein